MAEHNVHVPVRHALQDVAQALVAEAGCESGTERRRLQVKPVSLSGVQPLVHGCAEVLHLYQTSAVSLHQAAQALSLTVL